MSLCIHCVVVFSILTISTVGGGGGGGTNIFDVKQHPGQVTGKREPIYKIKSLRSQGTS